jgi:hemolysin III
MDWLSFREPISAWTHGAWAVLAAPGVWLLWRRAGGDWTKRVGGLVFGLSLVLCFGCSFLYHGARLPAEGVAVLNTLDHLSIYFLIAGTSTPIALIMLDGGWRVGLAALTWLTALGGAALHLWLGLTPRLATGSYLVMGWVGGVVCCDLVRKLSPRGVRPLWLGGLFYTVGALLNVSGWPDLAPGVFGAHEVFHLFVMAGSLCHYYFMAARVLPFERTGRPALRLSPAYRRGEVRAGGWCAHSSSFSRQLGR